MIHIWFYEWIDVWATHKKGFMIGSIPEFLLGFMLGFMKGFIVRFTKGLNPRFILEFPKRITTRIHDRIHIRIHASIYTWHNAIVNSGYGQNEIHRESRGSQA